MVFLARRMNNYSRGLSRAASRSTEAGIGTIPVRRRRTRIVNLQYRYANGRSARAYRLARLTVSQSPVIVGVNWVISVGVSRWLLVSPFTFRKLWFFPSLFFFPFLFSFCFRSLDRQLFSARNETLPVSTLLNYKRQFRWLFNLYFN